MARDAHRHRKWRFSTSRSCPESVRHLTAVAEHPRYHSALMTGNIEPAAHFKMELVGLSKFFTLPGAFGDESHDRRDLPGRWPPSRIREHLQLRSRSRNSSSSSAIHPTTSPAPSSLRCPRSGEWPLQRECSARGSYSPFIPTLCCPICPTSAK